MMMLHSHTRRVRTCSFFILLYIYMCMLSMNHFTIPRRPILNLEYVYTYIVLRNKV